MKPVFSIAFGVLMTVSLLAAEPVEQKQGPAAEARLEQYFPHLVVGGGSNVILAVQNLGSEEGPFSLTLTTGDGEYVSGQGKLLRPNGVGFWDVAQIVESRGGDLTGPRAYWIRLNGQSGFSATGIQTLEVGGVALLPYGVVSANACNNFGFVIAESDQIRGALAVLNRGSAEVNCEMTLYSGGLGFEEQKQTLTVPPQSQTSFYTDGFFGYDPGFNGGLVAVCDRPAVAYSLLQDRLSGDTNAVGVECFDLPEPPQ